MPDAWHATGFGFSSENLATFPSCYGGKDLKEEGRMKQTHVLYPLWSCPPLGLLVPWIRFSSQVGFYMYGMFLCIGMHAFLRLDFSLDSWVYLSHGSTGTRCKYFSRPCCLISANSDHLTQQCKTHSLFLVPRLAHSMNFTCAVSWMLLAKM